MAGDDLAIDLRSVSKSYSLEHRPLRRLWQQLTGHVDSGRVHHALHEVNLQVRRGEALGIVGRNGAGKSTLLQLICGVLQPSRGQRVVQGRIAALLELGAGFNPELTGRENVRLNGPLLGLKPSQIEQRLPEIVDFAGIGEYIDEPVRSYSSGMFVRLAFAMATSVEPDILVIDEALSVGDGVFARKSFERIMALKERGATLLFCSHSLFQVESMCTRAIWLHDGRIMFDGPAHQASVEYGSWQAQADAPVAPPRAAAPHAGSAPASILAVELHVRGDQPTVRSGIDTLDIDMHVRSDPTIPCPTLAVMISSSDGRVVSSQGNWMDGVSLSRDSAGESRAVLRFAALPLLKGRYSVSVYVLCERGINVYAVSEHVADFEVVQRSLQLGLVDLPHCWLTDGAA